VDALDYIKMSKCWFKKGEVALSWKLMMAGVGAGYGIANCKTEISSLLGKKGFDVEDLFMAFQICRAGNCNVDQWLQVGNLVAIHKETFLNVWAKYFELSQKKVILLLYVY